MFLFFSLIQVLFYLFPQFVELSAFTTSGIDCLLSGVSNQEIESSIELVSSNVSSPVRELYIYLLMDE
jgi:hypothetical protein